MKTAAVRIAVAIVLVAIGLACWTEAQVTRRVQAAFERFDTLKYDAEDGIDERSGRFANVLWAVSPLRAGVQQLRIDQAYWRSQQRREPMPQMAPTSTPASVGSSLPGATDVDPAALFAAANSAFRESQRFSGDRAAAVEQLDKIVQSYAEVLRVDSTNEDASFNYEYVSRYRDAVARERGPVRPTERIPEEGELATDLPLGPTIHGRPGAPPPEMEPEEFRTLVPQPADEAKEKPGEGSVMRKG
jgi:hypothetical protein